MTNLSLSQQQLHYLLSTSVFPDIKSLKFVVKRCSVKSKTGTLYKFKWYYYARGLITVPRIFFFFVEENRVKALFSLLTIVPKCNATESIRYNSMQHIVVRNLRTSRYMKPAWNTNVLKNTRNNTINDSSTHTSWILKTKIKDTVSICSVLAPLISTFLVIRRNWK